MHYNIYVYYWTHNNINGEEEGKIRNKQCQTHLINTCII